MPKPKQPKSLPLMPMHHVFTARQATTSDGSVLWQVVTRGGERIAGSHFEMPVQSLALALNVVVTNHCAASPHLHV
jgi:hypothetical protein